MNKNQSTLALYFNDISKYPLLDAKTELELGRRIKENQDMEAREQLIQSNLRLVISVAKPYKNANNNMSLEDLIGYGNQGLVVAADKYDYTKGFRFSTCAVPWIKQAITKAIAERSRSIRIPAHIIQAFSKYKKAVETLTSNLQCEPTNDEIAKEMKISRDELDRILAWKQNTVSLSSPLSTESEDTLEDICADENGVTPVDYTNETMKHEKLLALIRKLDPRTKEIVKLRFGFGEPGDNEIYFQEHTLEEIGALLKPAITRERVRQILAAQLQKWRLELKDEFSF